MQDDCANDRKTKWLIAVLFVFVAAFLAVATVQQFAPREAHDQRCDGPARYEAMREAYEAGRPQPC